MSTMEDKLLGEKLQYYYSSSEDEGDAEAARVQGPSGPAAPAPEGSKDGLSTNTGPKGVISDWRRYKQLQAEQQAAQGLEMQQLAQRLAMTCRSHRDEEREKQRQKELQDQLAIRVMMPREPAAPCPEEEAEGDFLERYRRQRMEEMRRQQRTGEHFGQVVDIPSSEGFLEAVDRVSRHTLVLIHIYEDSVRGAEALHGCLACLAAEYSAIKFCRVKSSLLGTSAKFTCGALPALLAYRSGELIGNFVRITDQLGEDFFAVELEGFLQECGLLPDKELFQLGAIRDTAAVWDSEDSDLNID